MSAPPRTLPLPPGEPRPGPLDKEVEAFLGFLVSLGVVPVVTQELRHEVELHLWLRRLCDEPAPPPLE